MNNKVFESENQYGLSSENLNMSALEKYTAKVFRTSQKVKKQKQKIKMSLIQFLFRVLSYKKSFDDLVSFSC